MATGVFSSDPAICSLNLKDSMYYYVNHLTQITLNGTVQDIGGILNFDSYDLVNFKVQVDLNTLPNYTYYSNVLISIPTCDTANYPSYQLLQVGETISDGSNSGGTSVDYDFSLGAEFFGFSFVFVMSVWLVSKNIGLILSAIKRF